MWPEGSIQMHWFRLCKREIDFGTRDHRANSGKRTAFQRVDLRRALDAAFLPLGLALLLPLREDVAVCFARSINRSVFMRDTPRTSAVSRAEGNAVSMTALAMTVS